MKNPILILPMLFCLLLFSAEETNAQQVGVVSGAGALGQMNTNIIVPLTATETFPLSFGRFYPGSEGGTIRIEPTGSVVASLTVVPDASPKNPGSFFVTGETDATFSIGLPTSPATLTNIVDNKTMEVSDWVSVPNHGDSGIKLTGGVQTVLIGATLKVGALDENPKGVYTGSYQITFSYN